MQTVERAWSAEGGYHVLTEEWHSDRVQRREVRIGAVRRQREWALWSSCETVRVLTEVTCVPVKHCALSLSILKVNPIHCQTKNNSQVFLFILRASPGQKVVGFVC